MTRKNKINRQRASKRTPQKAKAKSPRPDPKSLPLTGTKLWSFRLIAAVIIPALFLSATEIILRIIDYGYPTSATIPFQSQGQKRFHDNIKFAWRFFPPNIAREFEPFTFTEKKTENTYRIFIMGASAAQGIPDGSYSFGRILEKMLQQQYPDTNFEVIITAMTAINSHVVLPIVKDCAKHDPDIFIIYLGNNEVVGPYGAGTVFGSFSKNLTMIRCGIALKATRTGQLLAKLVSSTGNKTNAFQSWSGMQMFLDKQLRADDEQLQTVYSHFRNNLKSIRNTALAANAKIIFTTVASNLKDSPPFASLHRHDLTDSKKSKWDQIYRQGIAHESKEEFQKAIDTYSAALDIDNTYADLHFRLATCYEKMELFDKAKTAFIQARQTDTLRFRADNSINDIIRNIATDANENILLADAAITMAQNSPNGITDRKFFHEHVHMTFPGNYLLAKTVLQQVHKALPQDITQKRKDNITLITQSDCATQLALTDWDKYNFNNVLLTDYITKPPFTNQLYHDRLITTLENELEQMKSFIESDSIERFARQYRTAIQHFPSDWNLHWKYGRLLAEDLKDYANAAKQFKKVQQYVPHFHRGYVAMGQVLQSQGDINSAIKQYLLATQLNPFSHEPWYHLGESHQKLKQYDKAAACYRKTIQLEPKFPDPYINLAEMLNIQGRLDEAIETCIKGLSNAPNNPLLHGNYGILLHKKGNKTLAIKELETALRLDPDSANIRRVLDIIRKSPN